MDSHLKKKNEFRLADPIDIGLMKLLALEGRTTRKDVIDLYFIHQKIIKLPRLLEIFDSFYPKEKCNTCKSISKLLNIDELEK